MQRPCIGCGALIERGSRCPPCTPTRSYQRGTKGRTATDWHWRKLSQRTRKASPFCERCGTSADLTTDHVIPVSERPDLARDEANVRVLCRRCNAQRGNQCADAERQQVLAAIEARSQRRANYHNSQR